MRLAQWFLNRHHIGGLGRFIISVYVAAAINFGIILAQELSAAYARSVSVDGFEVIVCPGIHPLVRPRLMVLCALFIAAIGVFQRTFPRSPIAVVGLSGALLMYLYSWTESYRLFKNLADADINFLNNIEIPQVAYLYAGTSFDVWIAVSIFVCLVLSLDRLFNFKG